MSDKIREDFEAWILQANPAAKWCRILERLDSDERYCSMEVEWAYRGYQHGIAQQPAELERCKAGHEPVAWRDENGTLYPSWESVEKYMPKGRVATPLSAAPPAAEQPDSVAMREELGGTKAVSAMLTSALKSLVFHARTTGGTAGPDAKLMEACEQAEHALSLGGIGRAYMQGADEVLDRAEQPGHSCGAADMVRCYCGDAYPADSYDAGFIRGSGMCPNCDAAIPARDIPTPPAAEQPDSVKVSRELLRELRDITLLWDSGAAGVLRGQVDALLGGGDA